MKWDADVGASGAADAAEVEEVKVPGTTDEDEVAEVVMVEPRVSPSTTRSMESMSQT